MSDDFSEITFYRDQAQQMREWAQKVADEHRRRVLLEIAEKYIELAVNAERASCASGR